MCIRNLTLEDVKTKVLRIKNIDIGQIKNLKLCNIECEELDIDYLNNQEVEEIKNKAKISYLKNN